MLRSEAMEVATHLQPEDESFKFNSLTLTEGEGGVGIWVATFIDFGTEPPRVIIERWHDVYTDQDPDPNREEAPDAEAPEAPEMVDGSAENGAGNPARVNNVPRGGE